MLDNLSEPVRKCLISSVGWETDSKGIMGLHNYFELAQIQIWSETNYKVFFSMFLFFLSFAILFCSFNQPDLRRNEVNLFRKLHLQTCASFFKTLFLNINKVVLWLRQQASRLRNPVRRSTDAHCLVTTESCCVKSGWFITLKRELSQVFIKNSKTFLQINHLDGWNACFSLIRIDTFYIS